MRAARSVDVVVIGGGVVGLAVAHRLALAGLEVTLVEREGVARSATWAAGGMLAPLGEVPDPGAFQEFGLESLRAYPAWVAAIQKASGESVAFEVCGMLVVADTTDAAAGLRERQGELARERHPARWIEGAAVRGVEPHLARRWSAGLHLIDHACVDPRRLGGALARAARHAGVKIYEGFTARTVVTDGGGVRGIRADDGTTLAARRVVVAAGAWSGLLEGLPRRLPVRGVRGQMLAVRPDGIRLRGLVVGPGAYLIPREIAGVPHVVIGASMDEAGFTVATDPETVSRLRRSAEALVPALTDAPEHSRWAGLRPATADGLPILGPDPDVRGLIYATGHFRNGILLAPGTADLVHAVVVGADPDPRWAAFGAARITEADTGTARP